MTPTRPQSSNASRPRVGIPWRTSQEEAENNRPKIQNYEDSVRKAGGEPVLVPLSSADQLRQLLPSLDAFVLPGSPADVEPGEYGAVNHGLSAPADLPREETDRAILKHAFAEKKPVLAICYGCQLLNVYLGGTLLQDLRAETGTTTPHRKKDVVPEATLDPIHPATFEPGSRLATICGGTRAEINSSHHQAVDKLGEGLVATAWAPDGVVEAMELSPADDGRDPFVLAVQWHPEAGPDGRLIQALVAAASARASRSPLA